MHTYAVTVIQTTTSLFAKRECFYAAFHLEPATNVFFKSELCKKNSKQQRQSHIFRIEGTTGC